MAKKKNREAKPVRWADITHVMRIMGMMKNRKKGECLRIHDLVMDQVRLGKVIKTARGRYAIAKPLA